MSFISLFLVQERVCRLCENKGDTEYESKRWSISQGIIWHLGSYLSWKTLKTWKIINLFFSQGKWEKRPNVWGKKSLLSLKIFLSYGVTDTGLTNISFQTTLFHFFNVLVSQLWGGALESLENCRNNFIDPWEHLFLFSDKISLLRNKICFFVCFLEKTIYFLINQKESMFSLNVLKLHINFKSKWE